MNTRAAPRSRGFARLRLAVAALAIGGLLCVAPSPAIARWSASSTHTGSALAGITLSASTTISCVNQSIILVSVARVSWTAVTGATGYRVVVTRSSDGTSTTRDQTTTSIDLSSGVLGDLLTGLLAPSALTVRVYPLVNNGNGAWVSPNSRAFGANATVLPIGTTCGTLIS
ncbi:hypothetical protein ACWGJP_10080 [Microbacterium sp. NPDC055903]